MTRIVERSESPGERYLYSSNERRDRVTGNKFITLRAENETDRSKSIQVSVVPELGSNLVQFRFGQHDIVITDRNKLRDGLWTGCPVLWPIPNRVQERSYEFRGRRVSLEKIRRAGIRDEDPLIHGFVDNKRWATEKPQIREDSASVKTSISITKDSPAYEFFPWVSKLTMEYNVSRQGLEIKYEAKNNDTRDMPSEFAIHPYLDAVGAEVKIPGKSVMDTDKLLVPSGILIPVAGTEYDLRDYTRVSGLKFDHVWTDLIQGQFPSVKYPDRGYELVMQTSPDVTHTVLYTGQVNEGHFCLEPQTGSTDAINLDNEARDKDGNIVEEKLARAAHLVVVKPGESHKGSIKFKIKPLAQAA